MRLFLTVIGIFLIVLAAILPLVLSARAARAALLKDGDQAPAFSTDMVFGDQVQPVKLSDFRGRMVILYFYPKDNTPGCTKESCAFRDGFAEFHKAGFVILGCSIDGVDAHKAFIKKYSLPFPLLLDPGKKIATAYGAANGIPILGLNRRVTYVIDGTGKIVRAYPKVDPAIHAAEIIKDLDVKQAADRAAAASAPAPAGVPKPASSDGPS
jgi:peroxiredoxin Q/BCP